MSNEADNTSSGPVGQGEYVVRRGDCLSSIAFAHGHEWQTLWDHELNAELKRIRKNPNVLLEGDRVTIPPPRPKQVHLQSDKCHQFRVSRGSARLGIEFKDAGVPLTNEPIEIKIDGLARASALDGQGRLNEPIEPNAKCVEIRLGDSNEWISLELGTLDPIATVSGVQGRLNNLGFDPGPVDDVLGPRTQSAIRRFQRKFDLQPTGELDEVTRQKLVEEHKS